MIACLEKQGHSSEAIKLFYLMRHTGVEPNQFIFSSVVSAAAESGDLLYGENIHACIFKFGFESDVSVSNALIRMYIKNGCVDDGYRVFETMTWPDLVSWNTLLSGFQDYGYSDQDQMFSARCLSKDLGQILMIIGFAQTEKEEKPIKFLNSMQQEGVRPNEFTVTG
ncbi:pentatricopeptide repeat-containing protein At1g25360-like [Arachis duranensis]|uniref:Pentatricopeptide repeat-containing protein n=2 Tax=Arachis TaxID=3817 RepID=A0A445ED90_ARAHY|nr:pentatricopeptide repeat-containing protein At1g25360-like [Arachis hypogaea]XP_052113811.1 pentatricopeptide repeat-containing protein At1g25360-like [Arachis duranensis]RYR73303.1 hypothetical protein Ahy_A02g007656 [Arachis hypogaea]